MNDYIRRETARIARLVRRGLTRSEAVAVLSRLAQAHDYLAHRKPGITLRRAVELRDFRHAEHVEAAFDQARSWATGMYFHYGTRNGLPGGSRWAYVRDLP